MKFQKKIREHNGGITAYEIKELFLNFEKKSIDFAVMEKADNICVIPSSFGWNDVGSFLAFEKLFDKDENENICKNLDYISVDSSDNILVGNNKNQKLSILGIRNMIIVITEDNILVCDKNRNQDIKKLFNR